MLSTKKLIAKLLTEHTKPTIKAVRFGWVCSPAFNAGSRLLQNASPSNSTNPSDEPAGYTFLCWLEIASNGWVGAPYPANPTGRTTSIWCPTAKGATTGPSIYGVALYIKNIGT